jgi:DNA-binding MarR family transcriptional regulator
VPEVIVIEEALGRIAYLLTRARRHELVKTAAAVPIDRAAAVVLRHLAEVEAIRPSDLAVVLSVEPPHVTRQVRLLERLGYVSCEVDELDRRAQLVRLTSAGREALERILEVSRQALQAVLSDWTQDELTTMAALFPRMVDEYLAYAGDQERR